MFYSGGLLKQHTQFNTDNEAYAGFKTVKIIKVAQKEKGLDASLSWSFLIMRH